MKTYNEVIKEGFKFSRESLNFISAMSEQLETMIANIIGNATAFVFGGKITETATDFTIQSGAVVYNGKIYHFETQTLNGMPSDYAFSFALSGADNYPLQEFEDDADPAAVVYFERKATLASSGSIQLVDVLPANTLNSEWQEADLTAINWITDAALTSTTPNSLNSIRYQLQGRKINVKLMLEFTVNSASQVVRFVIPDSILNYARPNSDLSVLIKPVVLRQPTGTLLHSYKNATFRIHALGALTYIHEFESTTDFQVGEKYQCCLDYSLEV